MTAEISFTDEIVALLVLLSDGEQRTASEISTILSESFEESKISALKAAPATTTSRLKDLHYSGHVEMVKLGRMARYRITGKGREQLKQAEENEYLKQVIELYQKVFGTVM